MGAESEGLTFGQVAKKHGITQTTLSRWGKKYSGLEMSQAVELNQLQRENVRLKRLVAD